jgi:hypothetical protein
MTPPQVVGRGVLVPPLVGPLPLRSGEQYEGAGLPVAFALVVACLLVLVLAVVWDQRRKDRRVAAARRRLYERRPSQLREAERG